MSVQRAIEIIRSDQKSADLTPTPWYWGGSPSLEGEDGTTVATARSMSSADARYAADLTHYINKIIEGYELTRETNARLVDQVDEALVEAEREGAMKAIKTLLELFGKQTTVEVATLKDYLDQFETRYRSVTCTKTVDVSKCMLHYGHKGNCLG